MVNGVKLVHIISKTAKKKSIFYLSSFIKIKYIFYYVENKNPLSLAKYDVNISIGMTLQSQSIFTDRKSVFRENKTHLSVKNEASSPHFESKNEIDTLIKKYCSEHLRNCVSSIRN